MDAVVAVAVAGAQVRRTRQQRRPGQWSSQTRNLQLFLRHARIDQSAACDAQMWSGFYTMQTSHYNCEWTVTRLSVPLHCVTTV